MKVTPKSTESTKVETPAEEPVKVIEAAADKVETPVEAAPEVPAEEPAKAAKTADPIGDIPADQLMKADDEGAFDEEPVETPIDIAGDEQLLAKFLANPTKVVEEISDSAVAKLRKSIQDENNAKSAWRDFYTENKELEAHPELVQMVTNRLHAQWKKEGHVPSWKEGSKVLAKEAKNFIRKIKASDSDVEAVNTESKAAVVSSSGNPAPRSVTKPAERRGFVDQIRELQDSKGKTLN